MVRMLCLITGILSAGFLYASGQTLVQQGDTAVLTFDTTIRDASDIRCLKDHSTQVYTRQLSEQNFSGEFKDRAKSKVEPLRLTLRIENIKSSDAGKYTCQFVSATDETNAITEVTLVAYKLPQITPKPDKNGDIYLSKDSVFLVHMTTECSEQEAKITLTTESEKVESTSKACADPKSKLSFQEMNHNMSVKAPTNVTITVYLPSVPGGNKTYNYQLFLGEKPKSGAAGSKPALPIGAIVGIAVGAMVVVSIIIVAILVVLRKKKQNSGRGDVKNKEEGDPLNMGDPGEATGKDENVTVDTRKGPEKEAEKDKAKDTMVEKKTSPTATASDQNKEIIDTGKRDNEDVAKQSVEASDAPK